MRLFCALLIVLPFPSLGQFSDSIHYKLESQIAFSNQDFLSQWAVANRFAKVSDQQFGAYVLGGLHLPYRNDSTNLKFAIGLDYLLQPNFKESRIHQLYGKASFKQLEISIGKYERTLGTHEETLSTGSLALSSNAQPMPVITLGLNNYMNVPFTKGILQFKGHILHGWFEKNRKVESPYLHEKSFYLKINFPTWPIKINGGLVHFAQWGGTLPNGRQLNDKPSDFIRVALGSSAAESSDGGEYINALGNHLGILDLSAELDLKKYKIKIYQQDPFEDKLSLTRYFVVFDQLSGLNVEFKSSKYIYSILYEYMYTIHQGGPGIPDPIIGNDPNDLDLNYGYTYGGRDDYYNNYLYSDGWSYHNRILGNSLFILKDRANKFLKNIPDLPSPEKVINNRVTAHHLGISGQLAPIIKYTLKATYTRNFGTYAGMNNGRFNWASREPGYELYEYAFKAPRYQCYSFLENEIHLPPSRLILLTSIGYDFGNLYHNFSVMLGFKWTGQTVIK